MPLVPGTGPEGDGAGPALGTTVPVSSALAPEPSLNPTMSDDERRKRGGYKCGVCGFFPKKQLHSCEQHIKDFPDALAQAVAKPAKKARGGYVASTQYYPSTTP